MVNILHTNLCMKKLCARWVPRLLAIDQKRIRVTTSEKNLAYVNRSPKEFLHRFVTMDETWIHHYTPEPSEGSKQCVKPGESVPKCPKAQQSAGKEKKFFHYDKAPSYSSNIAQAKKHELGFESLLHPLYSPDLASSDYYLFANLKRWLRSRRFELNEEVEWETEGYFGRFDKSYYLEGIEKLKDRWTRCIELKGEYIKGAFT